LSFLVSTRGFLNDGSKSKHKKHFYVVCWNFVSGLLFQKFYVYVSTDLPAKISTISVRFSLSVLLYVYLTMPSLGKQEQVVMKTVSQKNNPYHIRHLDSALSRRL